MNDLITDELLDRQLREAAPYLDDAGFTARVLRQLPAPRRQPQSLRAIILIGFTILSTLLAYLISDKARFLNITIERLATLPLVWLFSLAVVTGILVSSAGLVAAMSKARAS